MKRTMNRIISLCVCLALVIALIPSAQAVSAASAVASEGGFYSVSMQPGSSRQLTLSQPDSKAQWVSSAPSVAAVDAAGKVTAKSAGAAVVYAVSSKDPGVFESWIVTVENSSAVGSLSINIRACGMKAGQTVQLTASGADAIVWSSSDSAVAAVDASGKVTAKAAGSAVIYAKTGDGRYAASCAIMVVNPSLTMSVASTTLPAGMTLYNSVNSSGVVWTTSNPRVATVKRGFIEAVGEGTAVITAYKLDGAGAQCTVTVTKENVVKSAYLDPFNVTAGERSEAVVVTSTGCPSVTVEVLNATGTAVAASFSASSGYTDKTSGTRTVRIWRVPVTFASSGTISLRASGSDPSGGMTVNRYSFYGSVTPAAGTSGEQPRGEASDQALKFIAAYEGLCDTVQYDVVNYPTIGNGIVLFTGDTFYNQQTAEEAYGYMGAYIHRLFSVQLNSFVRKNSLVLTQNQYDALISFAYNMGAYCWSAVHFTLRELLEQNPDASAIDSLQLKYAFGQLSTTGGVFYTGLWRRRIDEWEMFTKGDYNVHPVVTSATSDEFKLPTTEERNDPDKYKPRWEY